jgi:hypothetical protein
MKWKHAVVAVATTMVVAPSVAQAQSIGAVENARAKERQGTYLSPQDRNDAYGPRYSYGPYGYYADYYGYQPRYRAYPTYPY